MKIIVSFLKKKISEYKKVENRGVAPLFLCLNEVDAYKKKK